MAVRVYIMHQDLVALSNGGCKTNSSFKILIDYLNNLEEEGKMTVSTSEGNNGNNNNSNASNKATAPTDTRSHHEGDTEIDAINTEILHLQRETAAQAVG